MIDRGAESGQGVPGNEPPSPFSREGSRFSDALGADPEPTPTQPAAPNSNAGETWPAYPSASPPGTPYAGPGFDPQPTPPYVPYGSSRPYEVNASAAYGTNPYDVAPYPPAYGGYGPYGMVPTQHPRAVPALVLGIVGIALAAGCGVGGLLGIGGIVLGRQARNEIDAQPGRYSGRSQAVAGFVTGIIATIVGSLLVILFIVLFSVGAGLEGF